MELSTESIKNRLNDGIKTQRNPPGAWEITKDNTFKSEDYYNNVTTEIVYLLKTNGVTYRLFLNFINGQGSFTKVILLG